MKIICTKSNLAKGVSIVSKAVPSKTTMPILECILIDASMDIKAIHRIDAQRQALLGMLLDAAGRCCQNSHIHIGKFLNALEDSKI